MCEMKYPLAPLVPGIILGDILDKNLRHGLVLSGGSLPPFFTRPISAVLWIVTPLSLLFSFEPVRRWTTRTLGDPRARIRGGRPAQPIRLRS